MRKISEREGEKMIWKNARNVEHTAENVISNWDSLTERQLKEYTNAGNAE